jgi:hypothetical protein
LLFLQSTGILLSFRFFKHLGFVAFPNTRGFYISPTIFPQNNGVKSLDVLPPAHFSPLTASDFVGNARKNNPVLSAF